MRDTDPIALAAALNITHIDTFNLGLKDGQEQGFELPSGELFSKPFDGLFTNPEEQWAYVAGAYLGAALKARHPKAPACTHTALGQVDSEVSGWDSYFLVNRTDKEALSVEQATAYLLPLVYREGTGPGALYCHTVRGTPSPMAVSEVICVVERRYDI